MPYVDFHSADDYASLYYTTNTPWSNVGGFDTEKSTVIILHPTFLDSTWLDNQFGDPRLNSTFNLIAFDMRVCGKSTARPSGRHDSWVEAADLAYCHQALHLPPCHVLALESLSIYCALRFAILFPEMCLSLTLCNVPAPTELKWIFTAYDELMHNWCNAEDIETFEHIAKESIELIVGPDCSEDLRDELITFWELTMPPSRRLRIAELICALINRSVLKPEHHAAITQPVLLIHGERNEACPKRYAEKLASQLINAEGGAILYTVKGGSGSLSIIPGHASIANQVFAKFLSRLPHTRSDLSPPPVSREERMKSALSELADIMEDPTIASRDPLSSLSFSCLPPEVVKAQTECLAQQWKGLDKTFSSLGPDGRQIRKYSDRKSKHWFHGEKDGLSVAGSNFLLVERGKDSDRPEKSPPQDSTPDGRVRRAAFTPSAVDKLVIKGTMAKVVGSAPATPFQRLLL
ncbi:alpha/beta-hydrolase [Collybia nuda]|uniref:Alpha/beta-hydrolase n=1 Tax=Collybia nuda TaxID=64659 RepID=A0A9P5YF72_9AGAR|nr:alpha/beta-hydrolase [Collybia nuda]